jgi:uncharacterized protein DUF2330
MRRIFAILLVVNAVRVFACAPAPHAGERIKIAEESAVIVWDPTARVEHFIRRATFEGEAHDFGFLVPTPSVPTLTAVDSGIFDILEAKTARTTVEKDRWAVDWTPLLLMPFSRSEDARNAAAGVAVLSTAKMGGYELVVLAADDAQALHHWLAQHGYETSPDLDAWVATYLAKRWTITAFKIDKAQPESAVRTEAVRMSFTTDRPFFPYREPASQRDQPYGSVVRVLRLFFVGPERPRAVIGESTFWPGILQWSDTTDDETRSQLSWATGRTVPQATRLTAFIDTSTIRSGNDDLYFVPDVQQLPYKQPPWIHEVVHKAHLPLDVCALALGVFVFWFRRRRG